MNSTFTIRIGLGSLILITTQIHPGTVKCYFMAKTNYYQTKIALFMNSQ